MANSRITPNANAPMSAAFINTFADGWKIAERVQVYLWRDGNRAVVKR